MQKNNLAQKVPNLPNEIQAVVVYVSTAMNIVTHNNLMYVKKYFLTGLSNPNRYTTKGSIQIPVARELIAVPNRIPSNPNFLTKSKDTLKFITA
jgi:hypothetical protein